MSVQTAIAVDMVNVSKTIAGRPILKQLNLRVPRGIICGIQGHNGSGKSMCLRVITGLVRPDVGSVEVFGQLVGKEVEFPPKTGLMIDGPGVLLDYSGRRNLEFLAAISGQPSAELVERALVRVGLDPRDRRPVKQYSTGMRQRLGIAQAIMEDPDLLVLDEPTSSVDPGGAEDIHSLLTTLRNEGKTILITSHDIAEVASLCSIVYEMNAGKLRARSPESGEYGT